MANSKPASEAVAAARLAALGNQTRLRLFRLLVQAGRGGLNVSDLQHHLEIPASTMAHHLTALARADLVMQNRQGREVISIADFEAMDAVVAYLTDQCCAGVTLRRDRGAA